MGAAIWCANKKRWYADPGTYKAHIISELISARWVAVLNKLIPRKLIKEQRHV
jgi:hypothetical protein